MKKEKKETLSTGEIAKYCDVSLRTAIRWVEKDLIKSYRLPGGGDNRVRLEDFIEFLESNEMPIPADLVSQDDHIVIVDDDVKLSQLMAAALSKGDCEIDVVNNSFEAGLVIGRVNPSLIILDLKMPGITGFDVLREVRASDATKDLKVLVVSSLPQTKLDKAMEMGASDTLKKPFDIGEFTAKVEELMGGAFGSNKE